jgi:hypothetical protein
MTCVARPLLKVLMSHCDEDATKCSVYEKSLQSNEAPNNNGKQNPIVKMMKPRQCGLLFLLILPP